MISWRASTLIVPAVSLAVAGACNNGGDRGDVPLGPAPTITRVEPNQASALGGTILYIVGDGFDPKKPVEVWFGDAKAERAAVITTSRVQVEVPAGKPDVAVPVRLRQPGRAEARAPERFDYFTSAEHEE